MNLIFGCAHIETYIFATQEVLGITGLSMREQTNEPNNLVSQYLSQHPEAIPSFNLCIGIFNGYFSIGESVKEKHMRNASEQQFEVSPNQYEQETFNVSFDEILVNDKLIKLSNYNAF